MKQKIISFSDISGMAEELTQRLIRLCSEKPYVNIAVSGGNTPVRIFEIWRDDTRIDWSKISLFWVDERKVPVHSDESNYGNAMRIFERNPSFPLTSLHPMPYADCSAFDLSCLYEAELIVKQAEVMDLVLLGIGEDGHTASIFAGQEQLLTSTRLVEAAYNPHTKQERITLTGKAILAANKVIFLATGASKRLMVQQVTDHKFVNIYPASYIFINHRNAVIYADTAAIK